MVRPQLADPSTREAHDDNPTLERDTFAGSVEHVSADWVDDHVGAAAVRLVVDRLGEILDGVVDAAVRPESFARRPFRLTARGRDHTRAGGDPELNGCNTHP